MLFETGKRYGEMEYILDKASNSLSFRFSYTNQVEKQAKSSHFLTGPRMRVVGNLTLF
jgi:hypothetical protein